MPIENRAYIQFELFTDTAAIWQSRDDMNGWFSSIYIPMAGICTPGVARLATGVEYDPETITGDYYSATVVAEDGSITAISLVKKSRYDMLEEEHIKLKTAFQTLVENLVTAGILSNDSTETCT